MNIETSEKELAAFKGLNDSYIEMMDKIYENAPICHFRKMNYEWGEYDETWWECSYCGHTKET